MRTLQEDLNELHRLKNEILKRLIEPILDFFLEIKAVILYHRMKRAFNKMLVKVMKRRGE